MKNLKIFKALSRLNAYELNRFKKFVHSPYFNQNVYLIKLFEAYYQIHKSKIPKPISREDIWHSIFDDKKYNDTKFRKLNTDLVSLLEEFLAIEKFKAQPLQQSTNLLESVIDYKMTEMYNTALKTTQRLSERHLERNAPFYFYQYTAEKHRFNLTSEFDKKAASKARSEVFNIQEINDNLDYFFITEKLKYFCSVMSWKNVVKHDLELLFINDIIELVQQKKYYNIPAIGIYYQIYLTTIEPEQTEHYYKLKELIKQNLHLFPESEARNIFDSALNYCVRKVNKGNKSFNEELVSIYNEGLELEVLFTNGELTPTSFRNICIIGLKVGQLEWVDYFIETYSKKLNPKYRANAVKFNKARVALFRKKYNELVSLLSEVEFDDLVYTLDTKLMLIIAFYELGNKDIVLSSIQALKVFLVRRKNIPDQFRLVISNFIAFVEKIIKLEFDYKKLEKLKVQINKEKNIYSKNWILEKIEQLL